MKAGTLLAGFTLAATLSAFSQPATNPLPRLFVSNTGVVEGNAGTNTALFSISLLPARLETVTVHFATTDGTAIAGSDYTAVAGLLIFPPGATNQTIIVPVRSDMQSEPDEDFYLVLEAPTHAELSNNSTGRAVIWDDDSISVVDFGAETVTYSPEEIGTLWVYALRHGATGKSVTADFLVDGSALSATVGVDVLERFGTFAFGPGEWVAYSPLTIVNDAIREGFDRPNYYNEFFAVVLTGVSEGAVLGWPTIHAVQIADNDAGPSFQPYGNAAVVENEGLAVITVLRGDDGTNTVTVDYSTSDGSATAGSDYLAQSGTLSFGAGEREKSFTVPILNDTAVEGNETIRLTLSNPTGALGLGWYPEAILTIVDNDQPTRFTQPRYVVLEGAHVVTLMVARGDDGTNAATVDYRSADQTATGGEDYGSIQGTLHFGPGQSNAIITIPIFDDHLAEGTETFWVALTNATGEASLEDNSSVMVIIRDDDYPIVRRLDPTKTIAAGALHTLALKTNGSLWAWGGNRTGALGDGTTADREFPVSIGLDEDWAALACAGSIPDGRPGPFGYTVALKNDGSLWAWGMNGQWGFSSVGSASTPSLFSADSDWIGLSAGAFHSAGLKADGSLWAWGANWSGQLGISMEVGWTNTPVRVGKDNDWTAVAVGEAHTVALKSDGTLWAWGAAYYGQLGSTDQPVRVGLDTNWWAIEAGKDYTLALKSDGSLWAWGANYYGQLGIGNPVESTNTPVRVGTNDDWLAIAADSSGGYSLSHTLALRRDGSLWAWGANHYGQLGIGSSAECTNTPVRVGMANDWLAIAAGSFHSAAVKTDGSLWTWGANWSGQLGIPSSAALTNVPVRVGVDNDWGDPAAPTQPGSFRISLSVLGNQRERKFFFSDAEPGSYAVLYRGKAIDDILTPVALVFTIGSGVLSDSSPPAADTSAFYRVRQVPISAPLDLDGDGIDDVYEVRHALFLNPLNPDDAAEDYDGDGASNLQEYLDGTDPACP